jgi:hypothetical protein
MTTNLHNSLILTQKKQFFEQNSAHPGQLRYSRLQLIIQNPFKIAFSSNPDSSQPFSATTSQACCNVLLDHYYSTFTSSLITSKNELFILDPVGLSLFTKNQCKF